MSSNLNTFSIESLQSGGDIMSSNLNIESLQSDGDIMSSTSNFSSVDKNKFENENLNDIQDTLKEKNNYAVDLQEVSFRYENASEEVLSNINFNLEYGKISLLSGMSGEGKSTLFYLINGMIPNVISGDFSGKIYIDGVSTSGMTIGQISKKVGSVLQNAEEQIIRPIVKDEIAFGCENIAIPSDEIDKRINRACELMKLSKDLKTRTLSGGQKQRLITATTLAMNQRILIFDEPLANLDLEGALDLINVLKMLASKGYAILLIEHRLDVIINHIDDVWHIERGRVYKVLDKKEYLETQSMKITDTSNVLASEKKLIEVKNVSFSVKKKSILNNISFDINKGERIVLLGENGCGKTTLVKSIGRLLRYSEGYIIQHIDKKLGNSRRKGTKAWFKKVGFVFQNPNYQLFMPTVEQEILFGGHSLGQCQKIVDMFQIGHLLSRHPHSLSEGQKRKVSIAAILAIKPEVLILDEPTVGQDYQGLKRLVNILNEIHNETKNTMLTITHDKRCAEALADRVLIMKDGKIIKDGGKELVEEYFSALTT